MALMDVQEVADYLNLSTRTIYSMIKQGEIPYVRISGRYRFAKSDIERWVKEKSQAGRNDFEKVRTTRDPLTKRLLFMGLLTRELQKQKVMPIVVGGNALEFYTAGGYATGDIDIIAPSEPVDKVLRSWRFEREGRHWFSEGLEIAIEAPSSSLGQDEQYERILEIEVDGLLVYMIGIEDLIIDRLNAYAHWKSSDDKSWAKELVAIHKSEVDWDYLRKRAIDERSQKGLKEIEKELGIDEKD